MKNVLEKLFGSRTRVKILSLFIKNPNKEFYVREITRKLKERINSIRRELENLTKMDILKNFKKNRKKYFNLNKKCNIYNELSALILKSSMVPKEKIIQEIKRIGDVQFAALSGAFTRSTSRVDLIIVSDKTNKNKLLRIIDFLEKQQGQELNYTLMSKKEFEYRKNLDDKFLKSILDNKHQILINKLSENKINNR